MTWNGCTTSRFPPRSTWRTEQVGHRCQRQLPGCAEAPGRREVRAAAAAPPRRARRRAGVFPTPPSPRTRTTPGRPPAAVRQSASRTPGSARRPTSWAAARAARRPASSPGEGPAGLDRESRRASARPVADVALELDQPSVADLLDRAQPDAASCGRDGARQVAGVGPRVAEPGLPSRRSVPDQLSMEVPAHEGPRSDAVTSCPSASSSPARRRQGRRRSPDRESPRLSAAFPRSAPRSGAVARPGRPG